MNLASRERFYQAVAQRYHAAAGNVAAINIEDLGLTDDRGRPTRRIVAFPYGEEKNGARFQIFRLGWFASRPGTIRKLEEVVVLPDFIYLPHLHKAAIGRFVILRGSGFVSRGNHWSAFAPGSRILVPNNTPHGFVNDPMRSPLVFISEQSSEIKNLRTGKLDFFPAPNGIPQDLVAWQARRSDLFSAGSSHTIPHLVSS
jgi:mannose-6-phosphate isomerase-like protein (cupin superfamily)